jgi:hypothetical protein
MYQGAKLLALSIRAVVTLTALLTCGIASANDAICTVTTGAGSTLGNAIAAFNSSCPGSVRKDCDPVGEGWQCSTENLPLDAVDPVVDTMPEPTASQPTPQPTQGTVLTIQAENASLTEGSGWSDETSLQGYTGAGYIVWRGQDDFRADANSPPAGIKSYEFVITQPGTYEFTARVQARVGNGDAAGDQDNDAWVRFTSGSPASGVRGDSSKWTKFFVSGSDESWKSYTSGEQYDPTFFTEVQRDLPEGRHVIQIGGRSARFAIDAIGLTLVRAFDAPATPVVDAPVVPSLPGSDPATPQAAGCTANGDTLGSARDNYANQCPGIPRVDCDQTSNGRWLCSSEVIGASSPGISLPIAAQDPTQNPDQNPAASPDPAACITEGASLNAAIAQFAANCAGTVRRDCDEISPGRWRCSSQIIGSGAPGVAANPGPSTPATLPLGVRFDGNDLIALHYDNCGDRDDGHATAAGKAVLATVGITNVMVVNGTCGHAIRSSYQPPSEEVMRVVWGNMWLDSYNHEESAISESAYRWATTLSSGDDVWVAEGGPSDFTAKVLRRIGTDYPSVNRKRIHIIQHSSGNAFNEAQTSAANISLVKQVADYIAIPNGNVGNNGSAGLNQLSASFIDIARQSRFAAEWNAAFDYLNPTRRLDFSDTVELLYIIRDSETQNVNDFAQRYLR